MTPRKEPQVFTFGGATVTVTQRGGGLWKISWREARKGRSTTASTEERAVTKAKQKVRELAGMSGSRNVSVVEAEAINGLKKIIGNRSLVAAVDGLSHAVERLGGWEHISRAVELYERGGHGKIPLTKMSVAMERFLLRHTEKKSSTQHKGGLKKELQAFANLYGDMLLTDITADFLETWIGRKNEDGSDPGWRYYNNRLGTWNNFFNECRKKWKLLPKDEHAAELVSPMSKVKKMPEIFTVEEAEKYLAIIQKHEPQSVTYFVAGCWLGLRPFELQRIQWDAWDWDRGYVNVSAGVAQKTEEERFVPISDNVRKILFGKHVDPRWGVKYRRKTNGCCRADDQSYISKVLRKHGGLKIWPQDVMRHSYISYRLAQGHGAGQIAEWAGNSERVIRNTYRRPLMKEEGETWFKIGIEA